MARPRALIVLLALGAARGKYSNEGPDDNCAPGDRHCTVGGFTNTKPPIVWVGPNDGGWIKIAEDPLLPAPPPPVGDAHLRNDSQIFVAIAAFRDDLCPVRAAAGVASFSSSSSRPTVGGGRVVYAVAAGELRVQ